jgi:hypothetical protein
LVFAANVCLFKDLDGVELAVLLVSTKVHHTEGSLRDGLDLHMRRRIHVSTYEEEDTCVYKGTPHRRLPSRWASPT